MSKVLYITANPKLDTDSFSLSIGKNFLSQYKEKNPSDYIETLNLYNIEVPLIDNDILSGWKKLQYGIGFNELTDHEKIKVGKINKFTDQFIEADKYIFVTPMWNFTVPPMMKAYIDIICIVGKTFKYTDKGPVGLLSNKKALHIQASGGVYSEGYSEKFEFGNSYVKSILLFLGINSIESILIEGTALPNSSQEAIKEKAINKVKEIVKVF